MRYTVWQWSRLGRWADKSARPELVEGRAVGCSWFDRLTTSVGTDIGAQQTRPTTHSVGEPVCRRGSPSITDPLQHLWQFGYTGSDLVSITDPLNAINCRFVDGRPARCRRPIR